MRISTAESQYSRLTWDGNFSKRYRTSGDESTEVDGPVLLSYRIIRILAEHTPQSGDISKKDLSMCLCIHLYLYLIAKWPDFPSCGFPDRTQPENAA